MSGSAPASPPPTVVDGRPFDATDLAAFGRNPFAILELVLAQQPRWAATLAVRATDLDVLRGPLVASVLLTLPYGLVLGWSSSWRVAALFVGSLSICLPSLHVFSTYLGMRVGARRTLAFGLTMTAVAAAFTLGLAPILWFLTATMRPDTSIRPSDLSCVFLAVSMVAGIAHLFRCLPRIESPFAGGYRGLLATWTVLLAFITLRMGEALGLV